MAFEIHFSAEAEIELDFAACFFRAKNLEAAFLKDFNRQLGFLENAPLSFQKRYKSVRIILFDTFNYSIHFTVQENKVLVLRILNQRQDF